MDGDAQNMRTVEAIFNDFKGRRTAIIKALTREYKSFHAAFRPGEEKEDLRLFGFPDGHWEVHSELFALAELPVPRTGYNFSRDNNTRWAWSSLIAADSDAWLISVAFFYGIKAGFNKANRERLFDMISALPTISEIVIYLAIKQEKGKSSVPGPSGNKSKSDSKTGSEPQEPVQAKDSDKRVLEEEDKEEPVQAKDKGKRVLEEEDKEELVQVKDKGKRVLEEEDKEEPVQAKDRGKRVLEEEDKEEPVQAKGSGKLVLEEEDEEENSLCWQCGQKQDASNDLAASHDFWIACDECKNWYHGKCVYLTEEESRHFRYYKCPNCSKKRARRLTRRQRRRGS